MAISLVNAKADVLRGSVSLAANTTAAKGIQDVIKSNLGPRGTLKMLVGGAGQIKLTKDGNVLLHEMQIQHPTASLIARVATAQDDITGDGTTSNVLFIGDLMRLAERLVSEGVHPRLLCEGFDLARSETMKLLEEFKVDASGIDRELLLSVARTCLRTKIHPSIADSLTGHIVDAVMILLNSSVADGDDFKTAVNSAIDCSMNPNGSPFLDLHMIEILHMKHRMASDTKLIRGMVMDHGCRHPDMPKRLKQCFILTLNVSLEYEKSEVNSSFTYSSAEQRMKLANAERHFTDEKVLKIINFKQKLCTPENKRNFVVFNQKGIDPGSLDILAKQNIMALRRVKRRNMERLALCCGGSAVNSVDDLKESDLGFAEDVYEEVLCEDKFTFVEGVKDPKSCAILIKGTSDHIIAQIKDAIRDGLRSIKNTIEDKALIPGAGAFEIAAHCRLLAFSKSVTGKKKLGVDIFAEAMLVVPRVLAENSGLDKQEIILKLISEFEKHDMKKAIGLDLVTGEPISPVVEGIYDNFCVKKQLLSLAPNLAQQLLLVDEVIRAGKSMRK